MRITPDTGRRIFGLLMILAGIGTTIRPIAELFKADTRTSYAEAHILDSRETFMGIGPLRHYSLNVKYEFFVGAARVENQQSVDYLPAGRVLVRFDPRSPANNRLEAPDSSPRFLGIIAGLLIMVGLGLVFRVWAPIAKLKERSALQDGG